MARFEPLKGVRVLSFEAAFSLPAGTRTLAELGAEVVQVSRPERVASDYITVVDGNALSKRMLALDLNKDEGRAIARRLALAADVVCNNFRPRVMERWELDAASLHALRPQLIVLQLSGYGATGPWRDYPAYGPSVEAAGGMNALSGSDRDPPVRVGSGVFADQAAGRYAALALVAALARRQLTGVGQYIDLSMYESIAHLLGDYLLGARLHPGTQPPRTGNRDPRFAPQGIYPCAGDDEWVAITVQNDQQWQALRDLLDEPLLRAPELEQLSCRWERHDSIDAVLSGWTRKLDKREAAFLLQAHGIAAGPVQKPRDLPLDPHLRARGSFSMVRHDEAVAGAQAHPHLTTPWQVVGGERHHLRDTTGDGADGDYVLQKWLNMKPGEIRRLRTAGVVLPFRRYRMAAPPVAPGTPVDADVLERLGLNRQEDDGLASTAPSETDHRATLSGGVNGAVGSGNGLSAPQDRLAGGASAAAAEWRKRR